MWISRDDLKVDLKELHPDKCIPLIHWLVQFASCRKFYDFKCLGQIVIDS